MRVNLDYAISKHSDACKSWNVHPGRRITPISDNDRAVKFTIACCLADHRQARPADFRLICSDHVEGANSANVQYLLRKHQQTSLKHEIPDLANLDVFSASCAIIDRDIRRDDLKMRKEAWLWSKRLVPYTWRSLSEV